MLEIEHSSKELVIAFVVKQPIIKSEKILAGGGFLIHDSELPEKFI